MTVSLKLITSSVVSFIVLVVGATCLSVTLITTIESIAEVGQAWARSLSKSVTTVVLDYYEIWESQLVSATVIHQANNMTMPSQDIKTGNKANWTDTVKSYLLLLGSKHNYAFAVAALVYYDYFWCFSSGNHLSPELASQSIEWIENLHDDTSRLSVGGFRYNRKTLSVVPYTNETNNSFHIYSSNQVLALKMDATVLSALDYRLANSPPQQLTSCFWVPVVHTWVPDQDMYWQQYIICSVVALNRVPVGTVVLGLNVEKELHQLLIQAPRSPNGAAFIIQKDGTIAATTRPEKHWSSTVITDTSAPTPPTCSSTLAVVPKLVPPRLGCLMTWQRYPYLPLNALSFDFVTSDKYRFDFFSVRDGEGQYAISSQRLKSRVGEMQLNIVVVLPEQDLFLGQVRSSVALSVGLAALVTAVAIAVALIVLHFLMKRLEDVQKKMIDVANLKTLDTDEQIFGDDDDDNDDDDQNLETEREAVEVFLRRATSGAGGVGDERSRAVVAAVEGGRRQRRGGGGGGATTKQPGSGVNNNSRDRSWIAEVANLEDAYQETVRSMTNFTRYVSRAVVSELILQRKRATQEALSRSIATAPSSSTSSSSSSTWINTSLNQNQHLQNHHLHHHQTSSTPPSSRTTTTLAGSGTSAGPPLLSGAGGRAPSGASATTRPFSASAHHVSEHDVTVLFAEIEGFSSIWSTNPENHDGVLYILHIYFKRMCRLIMGHGGIVDKFLADSIMSYWGAPVRTEHHALLAVLSSLALLRETRRDPLKRIFETTLGRSLRLRCGVASGNAFVGTIGTSEAANYSVIGSPVTQAKHLQLFNKYWNTSIVMDATCMRKVDETITHRLLCCVQFEEAARVGNVYEVVGLNLDSKVVFDRVPSARSSSSPSTTGRSGHSIRSATTCSIDVHDQQQQQQQQQGLPVSSEHHHHHHHHPHHAHHLDLDLDEHARQERHLSDSMNTSNEGNSVPSSSSSAMRDPHQHQQQPTRSFSDDRTIAFSDLLSIRTLASEGVEELLRAMNPERSSIDNLLRWHCTRTHVPSAGHALFAEMYSAAARACVECRFVECASLLDELLKNQKIPAQLREDSSVLALQRTAKLYFSRRPPKQSVTQDGAFFIRAFKLTAFASQQKQRHKQQQQQQPSQQQENQSSTSARPPLSPLPPPTERHRNHCHLHQQSLARSSSSNGSRSSSSNSCDSTDTSYNNNTNNNSVQNTDKATILDDLQQEMQAQSGDPRSQQLPHQPDEK